MFPRRRRPDVRGELARVTGLSRAEAGRGNRALVDEGFAADAGARAGTVEVWYSRLRQTLPRDMSSSCWQPPALVARLSFSLSLLISAAAQSFDCARAQTRVEKMVCG